MGRRPYATAVKEASGYFEKDPQRRNHNEPKPRLGWPEMPESISSSKEGAEYWCEYCQRLEELNVLAVSDGRLLEQLVLDHIIRDQMLKILFEEGFTYTLDNGKPSTRPEFLAYKDCCNRIMKCLSLFGLTPSDRSRLCVAKLDEKDSFESWLESDDS